MTAQDLKNAILQLAVQGKLVPQDPNDEPASELLKRIKAEKELLIKEGKIKKEKPLSPISEEEIPFDIPESWEWVKIGNAFSTIMGQSPDGNKVFNSGNGIEFHQGKIFFSDKIINKSPQVTTAPTKIAPAGSLLLCVRAPVGKANITDREICIGRGLSAIICHSNISNIFTFFWFQSLENDFIKKSTGSTFKAISADIINNQIVPLPPLAEQQRIVAKIKELMPLVEEYGKAEERLTALNAEFPDKLRKSILQQAIQGKLTERDPADEPASELLKRIRAEKERLIKEGKIKKEKPLPPITEEEIPFEIPENWIWVRLGEITTLNGGYAFKSTNYASSGVRVIRISDFNENGIINKNMVYHPFYEELRKFIIEDNDILMCMTGGTVGKSCIIKKLNDICVLNQRVARIRFLTNIVNFGYLVLTSPQIQDIININKTSTNDNISMELIKSFLIPLPPLAEQQRIVDRVNELLAVCDELK